MDFWQIIMTPFSWVLKQFCLLFGSYGIALILFTIVIKIILFPLSLKGKKSMIKMSMVNGQLKEIQKRCGNDRERYNQEVQKFYQENNISPMGGCGWSMIPLLILMPLYAIIRRPLKYMMRLKDDAITNVAGALGMADFAVGSGYGELELAAKLGQGKNLDIAAAAAGATSLFVINFQFLGMDLAAIPQWKFWTWDVVNWNNIGLFLLPLISAVISVLSMIVSQKTNRMNKNQPEQAASNKSMMLISPLMSLFIGYSMPAGLCIYWIANSLLMMVQEWLCGRILRKDYEAAAKAMEEQARKEKEAEKQRRREAAERKAAAIAANKGKVKKVQPKAKEKSVDAAASREGLRSYARGRAYDPNRYPVTPYVDPDAKNKKPAPEEEPLTEEEKEILTEAGIEIPQEVPAAEQNSPADQEGYEEAYAPEAEEEEPNA